MEILISTMHLNNDNDIIELLDCMHIDSDCVVVSQCDKNFVTKFDYKMYRCTAVYSSERGLSKSRNLALQYASADIVVIADDDIQFEDNYKEIIESAFLKHPDDDILTFRVHPRRKYPPKEKKIYSFFVHTIRSYEIAMKRSSIHNIKFNTLFGTGSGIFLHGEENIFLNDCLKEKKKIRYIPHKTASFMPKSRPSTWFTGYNKKYFIDQGALYYELSHKFSLIFILIFSVRKYQLYRKTTGFFESIKFMITGLLEYQKLLNK